MGIASSKILKRSIAKVLKVAFIREITSLLQFVPDLFTFLEGQTAVTISENLLSMRGFSLIN